MEVTVFLETGEFHHSSQLHGAPADVCPGATHGFGEFARFLLQPALQVVHLVDLFVQRGKGGFTGRFQLRDPCLHLVERLAHRLDDGLHLGVSLGEILGGAPLLLLDRFAGVTGKLLLGTLESRPRQFLEGVREPRFGGLEELLFLLGVLARIGGDGFQVGLVAHHAGLRFPGLVQVGFQLGRTRFQIGDGFLRRADLLLGAHPLHSGPLAEAEIGQEGPAQETGECGDMGDVRDDLFHGVIAPCGLQRLCFPSRNGTL